MPLAPSVPSIRSHSEDARGFASSQSGTSGTPESSTSERLLSQLLLSFVERRINPQTIADVVRAQIHEAKVDAATLSHATCNGILEVLTSSLTTTDCSDVLGYVAGHPDFPRFLSGKACAGGLVVALRKAPTALSSPDIDARRAFLRLVEGLASALVAQLSPEAQAVRSFDPQERLRLVNVFKGAGGPMARLVTASPVLAELKETLLRSGSPLEAKPSTAGPTPLDVLRLIASEPDHVLALKGVQGYRLPLVSQRESWRVRNVDACLRVLEEPQLSEFQVGFLVEWFFDGTLRDVTHNETLALTFSSALKAIFNAHGSTPAAVKGLLRALQRDLSVLALEFGSPATDAPQFQRILVKAQQVFPYLLSCVEADPPAFARTVATWALQMPVTPSESRLFSRVQWQWLRVLATSQWEEDLKEAPAWVVIHAGRHAAQIFNMAPHFWIQEHGITLVERLQTEAAVPGFVMARHHYDYVEYLVRTLRRKSPAAASRPETLFCLKLLSRLQPHEEQQLQLAETRARLATRRGPDVEFFLDLVQGAYRADAQGPNAIARALWVLQKVMHRPGAARARAEG